jgi:hypothetical protein
MRVNESDSPVQHQASVQSASMGHDFQHEQQE